MIGWAMHLALPFLLLQMYIEIQAVIYENQLFKVVVVVITNHEYLRRKVEYFI